MEFAPLPRCYLTWDQSAESLDSFLRYQVYRRVQDSGDDWSKRARITDRAITFWSDELCASGVTYEYTVTQVIDVAGEEVESDEPSAVNGSVVIRSVFIHDVRNPSSYIQYRSTAQEETLTPQVAFVQPYSSRSPVAHAGPAEVRQFRLGTTATWEEDEALWEAIKALMRRQYANGAVFMLRQLRFSAFVAWPSAVSMRDRPPALYEAPVVLREVNYREEVD
jgi:hypothetical protein